MKKIITVFMIGLISLAGVVIFLTPGYASDWDTAGKIFAGIEGMRVLSGGNIDIIGSMTGINRHKGHSHTSYAKCHPHCSHRVWVPKMVWKKKYVPQHKEYSEKYGEIIVESHYIKYQVERGGKWIYACK